MNRYPEEAGMIVEVRGLRKVYGGKTGVTAVDGIDLDVEEGSIYGLLGPNGAGKTTTISICTTRALPTAGRGDDCGRGCGGGCSAGSTRDWGGAAVQHAGPGLHDL